MIRNISQKSLNNLSKLNSVWKSNSIKLLASTHHQHQQQQEHSYSQYNQQQGDLQFVKDIAFPIENGFEQNSQYGDNISIPYTTIDQYVWTNVNRWSSKVATVS